MMSQKDREEKKRQQETEATNQAKAYILDCPVCGLLLKTAAVSVTLVHYSLVNILVLSVFSLCITPKNYLYFISLANSSRVGRFRTAV